MVIQKMDFQLLKIIASVKKTKIIVNLKRKAMQVFKVVYIPKRHNHQVCHDEGDVGQEMIGDKDGGCSSLIPN